MDVDSESLNKRTIDKWKPSALNPKYREMPGEFMHNGYLWARSSGLEQLRYVQEEFEFTTKDIIVAGVAKSGNTFLSEIVRLLSMSQGDQRNIVKTLDVADRIPVYKQFVFLENSRMQKYSSETQDIYPIEYLKILKEQQSIRFIKTHLPLEFFQRSLNQMNANNKPLILYVYRNPKDVAVSKYHFYRGMLVFGPFEGDWAEFFDMWFDGWIVEGDWKKVVPEWLRYAHATAGSEKACVHLVSYEAMVRKPKEVIESLHELINPGKPLDEEVLQLIIERTLFQNMRINPMTNYQDFVGLSPNFKFMREGKIGDWKNWFTEKQNERFTCAYNETLAEVNELLNPDSLVFE